jgi:hypothetical protein
MNAVCPEFMNGTQKFGIFMVTPSVSPLQAMLSFNTYLFEAFYKKYGLHPLQNGGQRRVNKTWASLHFC